MRIVSLLVLLLVTVGVLGWLAYRNLRFTASDLSSQILEQTTAALQLRYLQTLVEIGVEKNTTIVFPLPIDMMSALEGALRKVSGK